MNRKIISFMHMSLDGFVAGPRGEMNWIRVDEEIFDYVDKRIRKSDTALYGRRTYQMMENYWPTAADAPSASQHDINHSKWYMNAHKVVLSRTLKNENRPDTTIISENLREMINELKQTGTGGSDEILLFGSPTATHELMRLNLIDGFWLFVNPIILGQGIRLFEDIKEQIQLQLLNTRRFGSGVTELEYRIANIE